MSATSGIGVSPQLQDTFSDAVEQRHIRFLKVSIRNETLVPEGYIPPKGSLNDDLGALQTFLPDDKPVYILARLDGPSDWLAISYVPDHAPVRDKMLYASTWNNLTKALGATHFTDTIFATTKADLTAEGYAAHKAHMAAPKPMTPQEKEIAEIRAAERAAGSDYQGARARVNHVGNAVGLGWTDDAEQAIANLGTGSESRIVILSIDHTSETLVLVSDVECPVEQVGSVLPPSQPCYAFYAWKHSHAGPTRREIVYVYSCPSGSPVKHRMVYSSASLSTFHAAQALLKDTPVTFASRKVETSDPKEIDEEYLKAELNLAETKTSSVNATSAPVPVEEKKPFARPGRPGRR